MGGIPTEAGHEDDGDVGLDFAQAFECFVAIEIGKANVDERRRIGSLAHESDCFLGVVGGFDTCSLAAEQMMGRLADGLVEIDDKEARAAQALGGSWGDLDGSGTC